MGGAGVGDVADGDTKDSYADDDVDDDDDGTPPDDIWTKVD